MASRLWSVVKTRCVVAGISPGLLFEWALPVLSGTATIPGWSSLDIGVQCWVLVALKEGLAAVDKAMLNQHAPGVMNLCLHRLMSEATSVHLVAPLLGLVSEVSHMSTKMLCLCQEVHILLCEAS